MFYLSKIEIPFKGLLYSDDPDGLEIQVIYFFQPQGHLAGS